MSTTPPITFPTEVEVKFKLVAQTKEDYEYLTSPIKEESIACDAQDIFDNVDLIVIEVNGIKVK